MREVIFKEIPTLRNISLTSKDKHSKYFLIKRGYSTFEAIDIISDYFSINSNDISYCGLKDEEGITRQEITLPNGILSERELKEFNSKNLGKMNYINLFYIGEIPKIENW